MVSNTSFFFTDVDNDDIDDDGDVPMTKRGVNEEAAGMEAGRLAHEEKVEKKGQESERLAAMAAAQEAEKEKAAKEEWSRAKRKRQQEDAQSLTQRSKRSQVQLQKLAACLQLQANNRAVDPAVKIKRDPEYLESVYLTAADTSKIQEAWDAQWSTLVWNTVKEKNGKISKFLLCYFRH